MSCYNCSLSGLSSNSSCKHQVFAISSRLGLCSQVAGL